MADPERDTHAKALQINLDPTTYGSIAEIGAGQEVARWFLQAGGASGTVARTISAYDMAFSDAVYGHVGRYVSRQRLEGMLETEYRLLLERLGATRGRQTRFFVFADTVSARNFAGSNECHGWVGLRFQATPGAPPNDIILHVNLLDPSNLLQQQAVGMLGVNLIHAAFYRRETLASAVVEDVAGRLEVDLVAASGSEFAHLDPSEAVIELVRAGYAEAVILPVSGPIAPPSEIIRKRPLVLSPGVLAGDEAIHGAMLAAGRATLAADAGPDQREPLPLFVITGAGARDDKSPSTAELLQRTRALHAQGGDVLVARAPEMYKVVRYALRYTSAPVRLVTGAPALADVMQLHHYRDLDGALMEALAQLFAANVRMYIHPVPRSVLTALDPRAAAWITTSGDDKLITLDHLAVPSPTSHLLNYLVASGFLRPI